MSRNIQRKRVERLAVISLVPVFLYHFILLVLPSLNTLFSSLTNWNGLGTRDFIGLSNYMELLVDPNFKGAIFNNLKWMGLFLTIPIFLGLVIGYILSKVKKGRVLFRAAYFLPYVISAAIAGKVFAAFFNPYFGINVAFERLGLDFLVRDWLAPGKSLISVAFVDMWHWWGFLLVLFMSALQQVDPVLYESAEVEGAKELQKMWFITLPGIRSTMVFIILLTMVWSISTFEYIWVMTKGGPGSEILSTYLYKNALFKYRAGYACSIAVFQGFLAVVIFTGFGLIRRKLED
ncbi:MAG: sugar ABC transporter permease [Spirochaetales bacterium]|nr:sugar ABC transporter permease [Spirochaetales bacterium]